MKKNNISMIGHFVKRHLQIPRRLLRLSINIKLYEQIEIRSELS
jgi:hypothetical protein